MTQPPDPNQNIEQQIEDTLAYFEAYCNGMGQSIYAKTMTIQEAKEAILALISKQVSEAELRGEKKTALIFLHQAAAFNDSPAEAPPIPDYFIEQMEVRLKKIELKQTPPTPTGYEQGGLERPSDEQ